MAKDKKVRGRQRKYPVGMDRAERRRLRALGKIEATGVDVSEAKEDTRSDKELLDDMKARFGMLSEMTRAIIKGQIPSLVVPGAPGIGKTYTVDGVMTDADAVWIKISGTISAIELFKVAYKFRFKGNVIVIDDGDKVFRDEESLNVLKAMTDSSRRRVLSWMTNSEFLASEDGPVETQFEYAGSVIFLSNIDFQAQIDLGRGRNVEHMEALVSRSLYLDLKVHNRRAISLWINYVCTDGKMFEIEGISHALGLDLLKWLNTEQKNLREYSLRTVHKLCNLAKMGPNWPTAAKYTLCR